MFQSLSERRFNALHVETTVMKKNLQAGGVLDLRQRLILRHRLLLLSQDVFDALMVWKSIERFHALTPGSFEAIAAKEAEHSFAPLIFFFNRDTQIISAVKRDIVRMAKDAACADIAALADAVQKLAIARGFYQEAMEKVHQMRKRFRGDIKQIARYH